MLLCTFVVLSFVGRLVSGQALAVCTDPAYSWSFNSLNQSPCKIATALGIDCVPDFGIPTLDGGVYIYSGEPPDFVSACVCNTVFYTLLSVCAACQSSYAKAYDVWNGNCSSSIIMPDQQYTRSIPAGTAIPHYAFHALDPATSQIDITQLQSDQGPEAKSSNSQSKKKTPIGPIVGGVIGGLVFIGAIVAVVIFFSLRSRRRKTVSTEPMVAQHQTSSNRLSTVPQSPPLSPAPSSVSPSHYPSSTVLQGPGPSPFSPAPSFVPSQYSTSTSAGQSLMASHQSHLQNAAIAPPKGLYTTPSSLPSSGPQGVTQQQYGQPYPQSYLPQV